MLIFTEPSEVFAKREDPAEAPACWYASTSYMGAIAPAGIMVNGDGQHPPHAATTVRVRNGKREVQEASHADLEEQLGRYVVIKVAGLDAALDWAAKSPSAEYGSAEVHPVLPPPAR